MLCNLVTNDRGLSSVGGDLDNRTFQLANEKNYKRQLAVFLWSYYRSLRESGTRGSGGRVNETLGSQERWPSSLGQRRLGKF